MELKRPLFGQRLLLVILALAAFSWAPPPAQGADFVQLYSRGKLLYRQRLFADAAKALRKAIQLTAKGKTHFGAHYYLAVSYFRQPDIQKAMATLNKARGLIKNKAQKRYFDKARQWIRALYGKLTIVPEVDPDDVGRLQLQLRPTHAFSHSMKRRAFKLLRKRLSLRHGLRLSSSGTSSPLYLPKGEYRLAIGRSQCLQYSLVYPNGQQARVLQVGSKPISLRLVRRPSCRSMCPPGWVFRGGVCIKMEKEKKIWPYALAAGIGLLAAGAVVAVIAHIASKRP